MTKLTVFGLSAETKDFVFSNLDVLRTHLKIIFPMTLLLLVVEQIGMLTGHEWVRHATIIPKLALYAAFALAWHRTSLMGPSEGHSVHPLHITKDEWKFIAIFLAITLIPAVIMGGMSGAALMVSHTQSKGIAIAVLLGMIVAMIVGSVFLLRLYFILPARSVGVHLTVRDAMKVSKGATWPALGATIIYFMIFLLAATIYSSTVMAVIGMGTEGGDGRNVSDFGVGFIQFLLSIPVLAAMFLLTAMNVTTVSKAYRWGMENNSLT